MDAIGFILFGAVVGLIAGIINLLLWLYAINHTHLFGIRLHEGLNNIIQQAVTESNASGTTGIQEIETKILGLFDDFMANKLTVKMPVLSMFIDDKLIDEIRVIFHDEMSASLPQLLQSGFSNTGKQEGSSQLQNSITKIIRRKMQGPALLFLFLGALAGATIGAIWSACV